MLQVSCVNRIIPNHHNNQVKIDKSKPNKNLGEPQLEEVHGKGRSHEFIEYLNTLTDEELDEAYAIRQKCEQAFRKLFGLDKQRRWMTMEFEYDGKAIGVNIKRYRKAKNLTQVALAELVGLMKSTIGNQETGRNMPSAIQIKQLLV